MQEQDDQHLDDIIKRSFEKSSKGAPDKLWGTLSSALDADAHGTFPDEKALPQDALDQKVKQSFSSLNERAPRHVWPSINRQLNIDKVWQGISSELDKPHPRYWPGMRVAAAILLLLLSGVATYTLFSNGTVHKQTAHVSNNTPLESAQPTQGSNSGAGLALAAPPEKQAESTRASAAGANSGASTAEVNASLPTRPLTDLASNGGAAVVQAPVQPSISIARATTADDDEISEDRNIASAPLAQQPIDSFHAASRIKEEKAIVDRNTLPVAANAPANTAPDAPSQFADIVAAAPVSGNSGENGFNRQMAESAIPYDVAGIKFLPEVKGGVIDVKVMPVDTLDIQDTKLALLIEEEIKRITRPRHFEAGPVMVYNNSWLLNNETKSSYDKNSLIATDPTYKQNWGLALNYRFSKKSLLSSEIQFISKSGQQYKMYRDGEYMRKGLELRYYKLYLQYQRNFLQYGKNIPSWLSLQAGAYGGYLQNKRGEIRQEESRYANFDYGLKLALGQEHAVGKFVLGYGVSSERGLKNVFRGTELLPAEFNKTYILNFGTYINMRYAF